jgi:hypothetical protein
MKRYLDDSNMKLIIQIIFYKPQNPRFSKAKFMKNALVIPTP